MLYVYSTGSLRMQFNLQTIDQLKPLIQGFRKKAGLTQADMAEKLGVSQQNYAKLESNIAATSVGRLYTILRLLNVEISFHDATVEEPRAAAPRVSRKSQQPTSKDAVPKLVLTPKRVAKPSDTTKW